MSKDIKIFVSHRIDLDSKTIDNPLYVPVRCGAVYDKRENITMLGDNTGDNISKKRNSFCELTVQYWAWKNVKADYYGLCHYRRYLSFRGEDIYSPNLRQGILDSLSEKNIEYCGLNNVNKMREIIESCDILTSYEYHMIYDAERYSNAKNIYEQWLLFWGKYVDKSTLDLMLEILKNKYPNYYKTALEYMNRKYFRGFNCFIMKKEAFFELCEFEFSILFELEKKIDITNYSDTKRRSIGYISEWLYGIWLYYQEKNKKYNIKTTQLITFMDTTKTEVLKPVFKEKFIPVVYTLTDYNRPFVAVSIKSLIENSDKNINYDIILLQKSFNTDLWLNNTKKNHNNEILSLVKNHDNFSIRIYDPQEELLELDVREYDKPEIEEKYYIVLVSWILKNYNKIIWLSEETIVQTNLKELYETDIEAAYIGAVKDLIFNGFINGFKKDFKQWCIKNLKLNNIYNYVSADVVLMNLENVRENFNHKKMVDFLKKQEKSLTGENLLNILFEEKVKYLDYKYNKVTITDFSSLLLFNEYISSELYSKYKNDSENLILSLKHIDNGIIPFSASISSCFWKYARQTTFYEELLTFYNTQIILPQSILLMNNKSKIIDKLFPRGSERRKFVKKVLPYKSKRRIVLEKILKKLGVL